MLPLISRVTQKVVYDQTSTFLDSKRLLYTYQSGFRKNQSTKFCLSYLNNKIIKGSDEGVMAGLILFDLQKAFDTTDHDVLLKKLYATSFSKQTVNWFKAYPSNKSFLANLRNNFSQPASVSCGKPEGLILGLLLFLIYVKFTISQALKWNLFLYTDYSCLVCQHKDINEIEKQLNADVSNMYDLWIIN